MAGQIVYQLDQVNFETLNAAMLVALGDSFGGMSLAGKTLHVHLAEGAKVPEMRVLADVVIAAHDPTVLNAAQQAAVERETERARLAALPWSEWTAEDKDWLLWWVAVQMGALPETERI